MKITTDLIICFYTIFNYSTPTGSTPIKKITIPSNLKAKKIVNNKLKHNKSYFYWRHE